MKNGRYDHITEAELLDRYQSDKDPHWIGILLERYTLLLYGLCLKYLKEEHAAKDAVQQIFLKVLTDISKYKIDYFKSWLYMVAKNHCLMLLRSNGGKNLKEVDEDQTLIAEDDLSKIKENEATYEKLEEAIDELNEEQRQCVILFYLHKNSYQQIAEKTGYSPMQVKSYIQNGKRNLKNILEKSYSTKAEKMDEKLKDILSNLNPEVDQTTLLLYLQGKLTAEQQHEVEKSINEDPFESDALEGLQDIKDKKQLMFIIDQLNRDLRKKTDKNNRWREKLQLRLEPWLIITLITILALIVISYIVIHLMLSN